jgi:hypothetical protein
MPAYLQLCMATWRVHGGIDDVCLVTDANLHDWIPEGVLDFVALQEYPMPQRKDAIEVAILARYGGLFLDVDTICCAPPVAIQQALADCEIALYGFHMAAVAAREGSKIAFRWHALLQQTLALPRERLMDATGLRYTELGNYTFELVRNELATGKRAVPGFSPTKIIRLWLKLRRHLMLKFTGQKYIAQIDPRKSGFIAEYDHRLQDKLNARERYESFWFDQHLPLSAVTRRGGALVALHHSWTPQAYAAMGFAELANDESLLSRYLRSLLGCSAGAELEIFNRANP